MAEQQGTIPAKLREYMSLDNISPRLSEQELNKISQDVKEGIDIDKNSSYEWEEQMGEAVKLAKQVIEGKSSPWPGASNVKIPLVLNACVQFNARTNPEIIQGDKVVKVETFGAALSEEDEFFAEKIGEQMSYQLLEVIPNWRSDTDKLTMIVALMGTVYRKSYYDPIDRQPQVDLCLPADVIINNYIASLDSAQRITHVLHLTSNQILERMNAGIYEEYSLDELGINPDEIENDGDEEYSLIDEDQNHGMQADSTEEVYEQHTYLDLDDDEYKEPYIVTVHKKSEKVLRIVARYNEDSFVFNEKNGKMIKIKPIQYFTDYHFIPSPEGNYLSLGYGALLYPINEACNSILNQLLDAGTLANRQSGFLGKSLRVRKEDLRFKPGEWKMINSPSGGTISQNIVPLPVKEPSPTFFSLLQFMLEQGKEISSLSDAMLGKPPPPNTPATTVIAMIEQGTKVYSSMFYRLYDSFKKEFQKLYDINKEYMDLYDTSSYPQEMMMLQLAYEKENHKVIPVADPSASVEALKLARAQALLQMSQDPSLDHREILRRYLMALKVPNIDKVMPPPPPEPPPPSPQELLAEAQLKYVNMQTADILMRHELAAEELELKTKEMQVDAAYKGGQLTTQKVKSITDLALKEGEVGPQGIALAQQQAQSMVAEMPMPLQNVEQRIAPIEQAEYQIAGIQPQQTQQPIGNTVNESVLGAGEPQQADVPQESGQPQEE